MPTLRHIGVLLAAGRGRRMGGTKQLTPWRTRSGTVPLVAAAYDAIKRICDDMIVVVGHEAEVVAGALVDRPFRRSESDPDAPMIESIRSGLRTALRLNPNATIVLHPGDHPTVHRTTLYRLLDLSNELPNHVCIPEYEGRGGHPVLIPPAVVSQIITAECPGGLGQFLTDHPELCCRVVVSDRTILHDIDTPTDLPP